MMEGPSGHGASSAHPGAPGGGAPGGVLHRESGDEYECVIYGIAIREPEKFRSRVFAMCDDLSNFLPRIDIEETVFMRQSLEKNLGASASTQELRMRRIAGDQRSSSDAAPQLAAFLSGNSKGAESGNIVSCGDNGKRKRERSDVANPKIYTAGNVSTLSNAVDEIRTELVQYGLYQRERFLRLRTAIRSMLRVQGAGETLGFLKALGFQPKHTVCSSGARIVTRDGIEIELLRATKGFRSDVFVIPKQSGSIATSPLMVSIRAVCSNEQDIERTAKRLRAFADDLTVGSAFEEVPVDDFLPRAAIR